MVLNAVFGIFLIFFLSCLYFSFVESKYSVPFSQRHKKIDDVRDFAPSMKRQNAENKDIDNYNDKDNDRDKD